ncbi:MAG: winged helix-turn-helix transcriptional regulator [Erysipelotrichaceae bacterium]|nr:winged helix-turn-helix transcriptional regulator [Erysipelotrichaceae bacterium]
MTNKEKEILEIIKADPLIEQSRIAEILNISRSTVAVHISSLQKQGYLLGKGYIVKDDEDYIVGIGACNVDIYGKSRIKIRTHYDHPADIVTAVGGVMRNVICNYVKLGGKAKFITAYSDDSYGRMIAENCRDNGIDISEALYVKNASSGLFIQVQDENNDMYLAVCDMSILENLSPEFILSRKNIIRNARLVVIDPSLTNEVIETILHLCKGHVPVFIDPVSDNYALKIKPYIGDFDLIKPNRSELENLSGMKIRDDTDVEKAAGVLINRGLKRIAVSMSEKGILYMDKDRKIRKKFKEEKKMVNASGAGDALMAAIIYGEVNGMDIEEVLDYGLAAGIAAIRSKDTINENMSIDLLREIIKEKK